MARETAFARRPGTLGTGLVLLGGVLVFLALAVLTWYPGHDVTGPDSVGRITFAAIATDADRALDLPAIVPAYFDWLAWVLLMTTVVVGAAANLPSPAARVLRAMGLALGLGAAAVTYWALEAYKSAGDEGTYALHEAQAGVWVVLTGFVLVGVGAAVGPRRV